MDFKSASVIVAGGRPAGSDPRDESQLLKVRRIKHSRFNHLFTVKLHFIVKILTYANTQSIGMYDEKLYKKNHIKCPDLQFVQY